MYGEAFGHNGFGADVGAWWQPGSWGKGTREGGYCDRTEGRYEKELRRIQAGDTDRREKALKHLSAAQREECPWSEGVTLKKVTKRKKARQRDRKATEEAAESQAAIESQAQAEIEAQAAMIAQMQGAGVAGFDIKTLIIPLVGVVGLVLIVAMMRRKS